MNRPLTRSEFGDNALRPVSIGSLLPPRAFSRTEKIVLDIAWREARQPAPGDGRLARQLHRMFGPRPLLPLGSEKLEALRQYGMRWCRLGAGVVPAAANAALISAGYTAEQIAALHTAFVTFGNHLATSCKGSEA